MGISFKALVPRVVIVPTNAVKSSHTSGIKVRVRTSNSTATVSHPSRLFDCLSRFGSGDPLETVILSQVRQVSALSIFRMLRSSGISGDSRDRMRAFFSSDPRSSRCKKITQTLQTKCQKELK